MTAKRLRVLVVSRSYPSDELPSLGLWVERPTVLLSRRHEVEVVAAVPWCPPAPAVGPLRQYTRFRRIPRHERRDGVPVHRPRFVAGPGRTLYAVESRAQELALRRTVLRLHAEAPFDLVHAHMAYPEGAVAHRLARRLGVPFVITEHAPWTDEWFASGAVRREALAAAGAASALLPVSTSVRDTIVSYIGDTDRMHVVPVGVDADTFALGPVSSRVPDQVLYVGWLNFVKGVDVLLQAMKLIAELGDPGRLLLVGGAYYRNTRLQEERLRTLAAELDLGDRVQFLGRLPQGEVARLMGESAVVVLPSRAESFGAVLVEALACGTPVVATRCGGPEDIVTPAVGRLVPVDDASALASALADVLDSRSRFEPDELRRYALARFEWPVIVNRVLDVYADIC